MNNEIDGADPPPLSENGKTKRIQGTRAPVMPGYIEVVTIAALVVAGGLFVYDRYYATKITVIDLQGYVREQKALINSGAITEEQWRDSLDRLDQTMKTLPANQAIISKDVVLKNGNFYEITIK